MRRRGSISGSWTASRWAGAGLHVWAFERSGKEGLPHTARSGQGAVRAAPGPPSTVALLYVPHLGLLHDQEDGGTAWARYRCLAGIPRQRPGRTASHPCLGRTRSRSRIFLLGAAGEQEENGLGASASGPARTLIQNVLLGSRVVSQKVNFLGQGNKGGSSRLRRTGEYPPARLLLPGGLALPQIQRCTTSAGPMVRSPTQG